MSDFADNWLATHPNPFGIPQLHLDPSLMQPPAGMGPMLPPLGLGGGSPGAMTDVFGHMADGPLTPDFTLGYGRQVGDPSAFNYNMGPLSLGADQNGQVTGGLNMP